MMCDWGLVHTIQWDFNGLNMVVGWLGGSRWHAEGHPWLQLVAAVERDGNSGIAGKVVAPVGSQMQCRGNPEWGMGIQQGVLVLSMVHMQPHFHSLEANTDLAAQAHSPHFHPPLPSPALSSHLLNLPHQ